MGRLGHLRNLGVVAHIDAGKTTVSERMLFYSGVERRMGEVHEGSATMDWMEEERRRGITIQSAATVIPWRDHRINLIDTPGHVDFGVEVERCMRVLDGAVLVVNGVSGVQAQTERVWAQMQQHGVRALAFVNQLDRPGADFLACVEDLRARLGAPVVPVTYPVGEGRDLRTIVDLLTREALVFDAADQGRSPRRTAVPAELEDEVGVLRSELLDVLAEDDEQLLADVLEGREPELEHLRAVLRTRTCAGTLVPVLCGAALRNVGIQPLLEAVVDYLPAPDEVEPVRGVDPEGGEVVCLPDPEGPALAFAFKLQADPAEDLLFARVYAGTLRPGDVLQNTRSGQSVRLARVLRLHAEVRQALPEAGPGEIVALTGVKDTGTGDTLADAARPLRLERLLFPEPVLSLTIEPDSTAERERLRGALDRLAAEDPSFRVREDEETGQWLVEGMGELHLEIKTHRLQEEFGVRVRTGSPRVAFRESLGRAAEGAAEIDRTLGERRIFGAVRLRVLPEEVAGSGPGSPERVRWGPECPVPEGVRGAVADALALELQAGPRFGFPIVGATIEVHGGEGSPGAASELGYVQAASQALRQALAEAQVRVLEPEMAFEVASPAEFMSGILGELNARGATIREVSAEGDRRSVRGTVALARMAGYATVLRSLSQGRAAFSLGLVGFRPVPEGDLAERGLAWS